MKENLAPLTHVDLINMHTSASAKFIEKWRVAEENTRIKKADHWSEAQKAEHYEQGRQAISIGLTQTKLNYFLSNQRANRTSWRLEATEDPMDELKTEVGTVQMRDVENVSNMKYLESDIYDSGISVCYGVAKIIVRKDHNLDDRVYIEEKDYLDVIWDSNATDYEKNKGLFMAEIDRVYRYQLEDEYGLSATESIVPEEGFFNMGRDKVSYWVQFNHGGSAAFDVLNKITHYQKVLRDYYNVLFSDTMNLFGMKGKTLVAKFRSKKEAEGYLRQLKTGYLRQFGVMPIGQVAESREERIDKYVFTYAGILEYDETEDETFPLAVYQAFHYKDDWWTLTDVLKSPQRWFDRLFSQIDYAFGTDIKNAYEVVVNNLAAGETLETAIAKIEDGIPIGVSATGTIKAIEGKGANPQWFQTSQIMQALIEDMTGGRSWQGLKDSSSDSGVAIDLKKQQGDLMAYVFTDNLRRFRRDLGMKIIERLKKYDKAERVVKLMGGELTPEILELLEMKGIYQPSLQREGAGYVKVNKEGHGLHYLDDASFELVVTDETLTESMRNRKLSQMILNEQTNPFLQTLITWQELKLKYMDIPYSDRLKLLKEFAAQQQAQAEASQQQMNIQKAEILQDDKKAMMQLMYKKAEADKDRAQERLLEEKRIHMEKSRPKPSAPGAAKKKAAVKK